MKEIFNITWSDRYITGNKEIDDCHKEIIDNVVKLYKMLENSGEFKDEIPILTEEIESAMFKHMDTEINDLKRFDITGWKDHESSHNFYKKQYDFYRDYQMPDIIRAVFTGEIARDYMGNHFFNFDIKDIPLIRANLKLENSDEGYKQ